jgi:hypothetical protein
MGGPIDGRTMAAVNGIRHSLQVNVGPGGSINQHPNPFFLMVLGEVDLLKAAEQVIKNLAAYDQAQAKESTALSGTVSGHVLL